MAEGRSIIVLVVIIIILIVIVILVLVLFIFKQNGTSNTSGTGNGVCTSLPQPANVKAISLNVTQVQVNWSLVPGASRYRVYVGTVPQFSIANSIQSVLTTSTSTVIKGLVLGRTYYILVVALNACNQAGPPSAQTSIYLGFPPSFKIVNRAQPTLGIEIDNSFTAVQLDPLCSGVGNDNLCIWSYNQPKSQIVSANTPLSCLVSIAPAISTTLIFEPCNAISGPNFLYHRNWTYDSITGSICHAPVNGQIQCIASAGPLTPGQKLTLAKYDGSAGMQWDLVQA